MSRSAEPSCTCCCAVARASSADRSRRPCALHLASSCSALPKRERCESEEAQTSCGVPPTEKGVEPNACKSWGAMAPAIVLCISCSSMHRKIPPVQNVVSVCRAPIARAAPHGLAPTTLHTNGSWRLFPREKHCACQGDSGWWGCVPSVHDAAVVAFGSQQRSHLHGTLTCSTRLCSLHQYDHCVSARCSLTCSLITQR